MEPSSLVHGIWYMVYGPHRTPNPNPNETGHTKQATYDNYFPTRESYPWGVYYYGAILVIVLRGNYRYTLYTPLVFPRFRFDCRMFCVTVPFLRFDSRTASADADADAAVTVADVSAAAVAVADVSAAAVAVAAVSAAAAAATADADADAVSAVAAASEFAPVFAPVPAATVTYFNTCKRQFTLLNEQIYRKINVSSLF